MKVIRLALATLFIAGIAQASEEFEIKSYSPDTGTVEIKCATGLTSRVFSSFSADDQQKITDWLTDKEFQSCGLNIETDKKEDRTRSRAGERADLSYIVTLKNQTQVEFKNVQIEYRMFYETQSGESKSKNSKAGSQFYKKLLPGETVSFETAPMLIRNEKIMTSGSWSFDYVDARSTVYVKDRFIGMHLCVSKKGRDGKTIEREKEDGLPPEKKSWADYPPPEEKPVTPGTRPDLHNLSETEIRTYTVQADGGDYKSAYLLCSYYSFQGNKEKTIKWVSKTRELIAKKAPKEDQSIAQMRASLERMEVHAK